VYGRATAGSGDCYGVYGENNSSGFWASAGRFVKGGAGQGAAVEGINSSIDGIGVWGQLTAGAPNGVAIVGVARPPGLAGGFDGDVEITGSLSKGGGGFKIDHPLDPTNKYLQHSFVESPDMKNVYDGVVTLDANGSAAVQLPDWFEALNRDFRYQLTPIGGPAPNLHIAAEVTDNRFEIAGGPAGLKVSWQVTGIRQDPFANANRIQVELPKTPEEAGMYRHPAPHGQPESKAAGIGKTRFAKFGGGATPATP
jgi:hypothetical protein